MGVPGCEKITCARRSGDISRADLLKSLVSVTRFHSDIKVVQKALERYEITGTKINRNKTSDLRLGTWKGIAFTRPFRKSVGSVLILEVWFGPDIQLEKNLSGVLAKVGASVRIYSERGCP